MKPTAYITGLTALALALVATASADTVVNITGATAFRQAALTAIKAKFVAGGNFKFAHDASSGAFTGSTRSIFVGTFPGVTGTTTIRCTFTGSVEGVRALTLVPGATPGTDTAAPTYYATTLPSLVAASPSALGTEVANAGSTAAALTVQSDIAFSDVNTPSTPYTTGSLVTDPAGVIVFTMMANEGSTITNVTSQQFRALETLGYQPLSLFTGNAADVTYVFPVGRNDGSGTRTTAFAETGYGITKTVNQYITKTTVGNTITELKLVPAASGATSSTVWGQDVAGNGGYNSGGNVATAMGLTTAAVTVYDDLNNLAFTSDHIDLVTWLGVGDASTAKNNGAVVCGYNGVSLDLGAVTLTTKNATALSVGTRYTILTVGTTDFTACGAASNTIGTVFTATAVGTGTGTATVASYNLSANDLAKVQNGSYTAWGYERMLHTAAVTSDASKLAVYTGILAAIPANIGNAGIDTATMTVARDADGSTVAPIN